MPKVFPTSILRQIKKRPWLHSEISVGQFRTRKELRLVNCSVHPPNGLTVYWEEPDDQKKEEAVWADIDRAFSRPVTASDQSSDYVPTQIIAELFRNNGFDGVLYRSALEEGLNLALFDIGAATMLSSVVFRAEAIQFSFNQFGNIYHFRSGADTSNLLLPDALTK